MNSRRQDGVILVMTIVLLVVLSTLAYMITTRVARQQHRNDFLVDYTKARYGCDSAVRYALATLEDLQPQLISRPNEPDFSDLFALTDDQVENMLDQWGLLTPQNQDTTGSGGLLGAVMGLTDSNDPNATRSRIADDNSRDPNSRDPNSPYATEPNETPETADANMIRGPYGPPWPQVVKPRHFLVGDVNVTIEIEDENAKYPIGWAMLDVNEMTRESEASFDTFCEWMGLKKAQIADIREELATISDMKPFKLEFRTISKLVKTPVPGPTPTKSTATRSPASAALTRATRTRTTKQTVSVADQIARQSSDFGQLLHSAMLDRDKLAVPSPVSEKRKETPLKYLGLWGTRRVNINTAPRCVLEALFTFGGDARKIADIIIENRRLEPFKDMDSLKDVLFSYSDSLRACEGYITFTSSVFTIHVKAVSGTATALSTIAITKEGKKVNRIAVLNG